MNHLECLHAPTAALYIQLCTGYEYLQLVKAKSSPICAGWETVKHYLLDIEMSYTPLHFKIHVSDASMKGLIMNVEGKQVLVIRPRPGWEDNM